MAGIVYLGWAAFCLLFGSNKSLFFFHIGRDFFGYGMIDEGPLFGGGLVI